MIIVYTPQGGEPEHYDASTLKVSEASIVQRTVDMKWADITAGLEADDLDAMRGIVWVLKKRSNPSLRWNDFDPGVTEMTGRLSKTEVKAYIDNAFAMVDTDPEVTEERVDAILRGRLPLLAADADHALALLDARARDPKAPEPTSAARQEDSPPEDPSPSQTSTEPEAPTSASSPTSSTSPLPSSTTSPSATSTP